MIGRKLDARSYTVMLLMVVSVLLALNLFAQDDKSSYAGLGQVASALDGVANANASIAASIDGLAAAVSALDLSLEVPEGGAAGALGAVASGGTGEVGEGEVMLPTGDSADRLMDEMEAESDYKGSFNVN